MLDMSRQWKMIPGFHVSLVVSYRSSNRPDGKEPPRGHEDIEGDL